MLKGKKVRNKEEEKCFDEERVELKENKKDIVSCWAWKRDNIQTDLCNRKENKEGRELEKWKDKRKGEMKRKNKILKER